MSLYDERAYSRAIDSVGRIRFTLPSSGVDVDMTASELVAYACSVPKLQAELAVLEDSNMKLLTAFGAALLVIVAHCAYRFFTAGTLL